MNNNNRPNDLFPNENIILTWDKASSIGAGLQNLGNTCYMNSVLQCLTYTAPLANYLLSREHSQTCTETGFCMMCLMQKHIAKVMDKPKEGFVVPYYIYCKLQSIADHFIQYRQEDAHEFLRYTIDALQQACWRNSPDARTTLISQVFQGCLRSRVKCLSCTGASDTYDQFMDIQLDIRMSDSINQALRQYVQPEQLGDGCYRCSMCHQMVTASKTVTVHQPSNVLTLCLNRFDVFSNRKIMKSVAYPECLDLQHYTSEPNGTPIIYNLYAVLVHAGTTCNSGHYFCYVKGPKGNWYKMNDSSVTSVDLNTVLTQQAYLLFYIRAQNDQPSTTSSLKTSKADSEQPSSSKQHGFAITSMLKKVLKKADDKKKNIMKNFSKEGSGRKGLKRPLSDILDTRETSVVPKESLVPKKRIIKEKSRERNLKMPLPDILEVSGTSAVPPEDPSRRKNHEKPLRDILEAGETEGSISQKNIPSVETTRKDCKRPLSDILDDQPDNKRFKPDTADLHKTPIRTDGKEDCKMMPKTSEADRLLPEVQISETNDKKDENLQPKSPKEEIKDRCLKRPLPEEDKENENEPKKKKNETSG